MTAGCGAADMFFFSVQNVTKGLSMPLSMSNNSNQRSHSPRLDQIRFLTVMSFKFIVCGKWLQCV